MTEVLIPIAPISKKIIETERGASPVRLIEQDLLYSIFHIKKAKGTKPKVKLSRDILTKEIGFIVSERIARTIIENALDIAHFLYKYHLDQLCRFVYAKWEGKENINVKGAIISFYARYNIEEDDFALETAYKRVQRFFWKKNAEIPTFSLKNKTSAVLQYSKRNSTKLKGLLLFTEQEIIDIHNSFFGLFYRMNHNAPENYTDYFPNWLDFHYRGIHVKKIAKSKELTDKAIYYRIRQFDNQIRIDSDFRAIVVAVLANYLPENTEKVLPIAV